MKNTAIILLSLIAFVPFRTDAQTYSGAWFTTISPAAGGAKTAISISNSGNISTGFTWNFGGSSLFKLGIGFSGAYGAPSGAWDMTLTNFNVAPIGYATNLTTGVSRNFTTFEFSEVTIDGQPAKMIMLGLQSGLPLTNGNTLAYIFNPSPAEFELDLAFDNFTIGTYNSQPNPDISMNVEIVPEPSTYALLALAAAGLGAHVLRRRRW